MRDDPLDNLKFTDGLIVAIVQDFHTDEVLMCAYMNPEAVKKSVETGIAHYWSRSRKKLWKKGESSGHLQLLKEVLVDCDGDTLLVKVEQRGGACHTGYRSCFYRTINGKITQKRLFDPDEVY